MTESTRRMRAAASPHKREAWQANREMASSSYRVVQAGYAWNVFDGDAGRGRARQRCGGLALG
jgi:hypothetical protein